MKILDFFKKPVQQKPVNTEERARKQQIAQVVKTTLADLKAEIKDKVTAIANGFEHKVNPYKEKLSAINLMSQHDGLFRTVAEAKKAINFIKSRFTTGMKTMAQKPMPAADLNLTQRIRYKSAVRPTPRKDTTSAIFDKAVLKREKLLYPGVLHEKVLSYMVKGTFSTYAEAHAAFSLTKQFFVIQAA